MSKKTTLEMFKEIKTLEVADSSQMTVEYCLPFMCEKVESELERLEAIDNAKPSEALEYFETFLRDMKDIEQCSSNYFESVYWKYKHTFETIIKQALQQAEKEHKALEIIKEKNVLITCLKEAKDVESYNACVMSWQRLDIDNDEEFDLLKEVLKDEK